MILSVGHDPVIVDLHHQCHPYVKQTRTLLHHVRESCPIAFVLSCSRKEGTGPCRTRGNVTVSKMKSGSGAAGPRDERSPSSCEQCATLIPKHYAWNAPYLNL